MRHNGKIASFTGKEILCLAVKFFDGRPYYFEDNTPAIILCEFGNNTIESNFSMDERRKKYTKEKLEITFIVDSGLEYRQLHEKAMSAIFMFIKEKDVFKSACKVLCYRFDKKYGYVAIEVYVANIKEK